MCLVREDDAPCAASSLAAFVSQKTWGAASKTGPSPSIEEGGGGEGGVGTIPGGQGGGEREEGDGVEGGGGIGTRPGGQGGGEEGGSGEAGGGIDARRV